MEGIQIYFFFPMSLSRISVLSSERGSVYVDINDICIMSSIQTWKSSKPISKTFGVGLEGIKNLSETTELTTCKIF